MRVPHDGVRDATEQRPGRAGQRMGAHDDQIVVDFIRSLDDRFGDRSGGLHGRAADGLPTRLC